MVNNLIGNKERDKSMIITDSAKVMLQEALTSSSNDCLEVKLQKSCCGTSVFLQLGKLTAADQQIILINGISLKMDQKAAEYAEDITIDCKDGKLVIDDPKASGCC